tara:strand:+ start:382 stop:720 length:339 start_codon:yes stop_codon:yes gene_type:complete
MTDRKFSSEELTIMQMICEFSYAKHGDQLELYSYFNPTDINTLGHFHSKEFAEEHSRGFLDWALRQDVPVCRGYEGELKNMSDETKEEVTDLLDNFMKWFELEDMGYLYLKI